MTPPATTAAADAIAALERLAGLPFAKGHGTGNDFVLVADPDGGRVLGEAEAAALCNRHLGIGADGLIRAIRSSALPEGRAVLAEEPAAEWFMDYRNADGSLSEMCGNGVRVFVAFLLDQGLVHLAPGEVLPIGTRAGVKRVERRGQGFAVDMGPWEFIFPAQAQTEAADSTVEAVGLDVARPALSVSMGNPHTVVALAEAAELVGLGLHTAPAVEPTPPHGTNVEFVVPAEPLVADGAGTITMRVHERGVGETQSCGTGACAAAVAIRHWAGAGAPDRWHVNVPGGRVEVAFVPGPEGREHVELAGPAVVVAHGTLG
ncbi:diaminopimelate epimerase [Sinomonas sp. R1AF57]|jgi:diaminopimelate epimerase|uniref:diaminopimelate epimerase n=1 Tax=Sinomonas sp. R1AF57 TaxID=2020377 RepID=UPI000B621BF9|nr:diaminopimelate epimerase [Sinomonas sp. R1AF57]ASN51654.1 diaminopimelate epimerase [Sinomonas sp. R1AF57]